MRKILIILAALMLIVGLFIAYEKFLNDKADRQAPSLFGDCDKGMPNVCR